MYSVYDYGRMFYDKVRMEAYTEALRRSVKPGSVVADIGAGTGIMSLLACQYGARKVYAIDPNDAIHVLPAIARENGYEDRIECIQELSNRVTLPEQVDVIVSDMRGAMPVIGNALVALADARDRFLKPGGVLMPQQDTIYLALVEAPDYYANYIDIWRHNAYDLNMQAGRDIVVNSSTREMIRPEQLLSKSEQVVVLDYTTRISPKIRSHLSFTATRSGVAHGLQAWFDTVIVEGVAFSNTPELPDTIYGRLFLPWREPVTISQGDEIRVEFNIDLVNDDSVYRWHSQVLSQAQGGRVIADFRQSSFDGFPLDPAAVHKRSGRHVPKRNEDAEVDLMVLQGMDGDTSQMELAQRLAAAFPKRFPTWRHGLGYIGQKSLKYSR